jgi:hypothetical protein
VSKPTGVMLAVLVVLTCCGLGHAGAGEPQTGATWLYEGLPPQEAGSARLGLQDSAEVRVQVSIKRKTMRCDDLEAHVDVLQSGGTRADSYACLGVERPDALTELIVGYGAGRHYYKITFAYSQTSQTVAYAIRRVAGTGVIDSQEVVVDVRPAS